MVVPFHTKPEHSKSPMIHRVTLVFVDIMTVYKVRGEGKMEIGTCTFWPVVAVWGRGRWKDEETRGESRSTFYMSTQTGADGAKRTQR